MRVELPESFEKRMQEMLGDEYESYIESYDNPRQYGLRINPMKITEEELAEGSGFSLDPIPWTKTGYFYKEEDQPARHPYYSAGLYYLQEPSAMTPASRLPIQEGDYVLDLCAAPGGKATELGARLKGTGFLLANDISNSRAKALLKNLELAGLSNIYVTSEDPKRLTGKFPSFFDKILIDAPCSGEGMFHKEPKMAEYWEEKPPAYYAGIQKELICQGAQMLRPGGMLLYSTCTFSKKENEEVIAYLLESCPDMEVMQPKWYEGFTKGFPLAHASEEINRQLSLCIRIFPHKMPGEGHFAALLRKKGEKAQKEKTKAEKKSATELPKEAEEFLRLVSLDFSEGSFYTEKDRLYFLPGTVRLPKLRYLRTGLFLGESRKKRFEPSQALAMALSPDTFASCICLSSDDVRTVKYLKGETIEVSDLKPAKEKGWQLVCVDGFALGFGKLERGILKNKYYAGWRLQ